jgi:hypothetical protein
MSLSQNYPTTRPTLTLDFAKAKRVDPRVTFTRVTAATYFDASGTLRSAAANAPRIDFDPATLLCRGLLIEEQRTNFALYSQQFDDSYWTKSNSTITADAIAAPDGTSTGDKLVEDTATGEHAVGRPFPFTSGTTYTGTIYAKKAERTLCRVGAGNPNTWAAGIIVDLSNGTKTSTVAGSGTVTDVGNGWYRISVTGQALATASTNFTVRLVSSGTTISYEGDGTSGVYIWGAQLEEGAFPTSYIPTTTASLTRAADVASVNTLSPWFNAAEGTIYSDFAGRVAGTQPYISMLANTGETERIYQRYVSGQYLSFVRIANVDIAGVYNPSQGSAVNAKNATAYNSSQLAVSTNGQAVTGAAVASVSGVPSGLNKLWLGSFAGSSSFANGHIQRITYYNTRLPNAQLQALTAP